MTPEKRLELIRRDDPDAYLSAHLGLPMIVTRLALEHKLVAWRPGDPSYFSLQRPTSRVEKLFRAALGELTWEPDDPDAPLLRMVEQDRWRPGPGWIDEVAPFGPAEYDHAREVLTREDGAREGGPGGGRPQAHTRSSRSWARHRRGPHPTYFGHSPRERRLRAQMIAVGLIAGFVLGWTLALIWW